MSDADTDARADADTNADRPPNSAAGHDLLSALAAGGLVALFFGASAFALTTFVDDATAARTPRASRTRSVAQMLVCLACAAIGAFAQARGLAAARLLVSDVVVAALAGAALDPRYRSRLSIYAVGGALVIVLAFAALDAMWSAFVSALVAAVPYVVTAFMQKDRSASACDALLAALAGATLGMTGAVCVLIVASLSAIVASNVRKDPSARASLATFTAALTLAAIFYNVSVGT